MSSPVNCTDSELSTFFLALEAGYLPTYYSDASQCAQSKSMDIASKSYQQGKKTAFFHGFQSLPMSPHSMVAPGADLSMSSLADSPAKTSAQLAQVPVSMGSEADCGPKWFGLFARYSQSQSKWKTAQCSLLGDLDEFSEIWPRWGSMRNGACYQQPIPALPTYENESGLWPTPTAGNHKSGGYLAEWGGSWARKKMAQLVPQEEMFGPLNPDWVEWLMGWPIGWTDLKPLATGRFQEWLQQHGRS